ncbi:DUF1292 domain-containing protein [Clostridium sp. JN-9]|uniref:DUF1292 domain-containing protein n=1 Tax=Clostridium sp. JN-9 TaxID=2507159 RepID=UPI000FFE1568|nr:DUF1292 domain-containing protein [Clostridium sp. JN-9]QAT41676.1 DUF1292 domain-containing protein [Clostridium sp. JN-9]
MDNEKLHDCGCGHDHDEHECGCGHDHDEHENCGCGCDCGEGDALTVELEDENGNLVQCEVVDGFEYKDSEYALVQHPNGEVYLFKVVGEGDAGELVVPDDAEFEEVSKHYESLLESEE